MVDVLLFVSFVLPVPVLSTLFVPVWCMTCTVYFVRSCMVYGMYCVLCSFVYGVRVWCSCMVNGMCTKLQLL